MREAPYEPELLGILAETLGQEWDEDWVRGYVSETQEAAREDAAPDARRLGDLRVRGRWGRMVRTVMLLKTVEHAVCLRGAGLPGYLTEEHVRNSATLGALKQMIKKFVSATERGKGLGRVEEGAIDRAVCFAGEIVAEWFQDEVDTFEEMAGWAEHGALL